MSKLNSYNPSNNKLIGSVDISTEKEIQQKVKLARNAFAIWGNISVKERINYLKKIYKEIENRKDEISNLVSTEMGFPIRDQKLFDIGDGQNYFNWYLENSEKILEPEITFENNLEKHQVYYEPYGVAAVIQPWNFPFCQWSWSVVPNLIAGNTVVFKHSEECPLSGKLIEEIISSTDLPTGVFNEIYGDGKVGEILTDQNIDLIVFTGSYKVGQKIYEKAASKFIKAILELGGSAPGIIFSDTDIDSVVESVYALRFTNCGQACDGLKRLIVHESIFDQVVDKLKTLVESKIIGDPLDENCDLGPLVAKRQLDLIEAQIEDAITKEAKIITEVKIPSNLTGSYFQPTLLTNIKKEMRVWTEEVFGPVLPIISFKSEEEAIKLANDTQYGLGGYVFSKDLEKAQRVAKQIKTGMVSVNGTNYVCPHNPFGGYKHSGIGREHGHFGLQELSQLKVIARNK